jgi:MFS family permease
VKLEYKWIVLINTTIGMLMASINQTIVLISLPAIFSGLHVDPLGPGQSNLLLWLLMGYSAVTTVLLVTFGRIADIFGRVRIYNLGFVVFTVGSLLCALTPSVGTLGAVELIAFRMLQGLGGACLFANSIALLTDAFPASQRGFSLGINQIAFIAGNLIGVVLGGFLAAINWRLDFLISVPVGVLGSAWAYLALHEIGKRHAQPIDWLGNATFAGGLLALMFGLTEALTPYGNQTMGWSNPTVLLSLRSASCCWSHSESSKAARATRCSILVSSGSATSSSATSQPFSFHSRAAVSCSCSSSGCRAYGCLSTASPTLTHLYTRASTPCLS